MSPYDQGNLQGHEASLKKEREALKVAPLIGELEAADCGGTDWHYLKHALAALLECRRVLANAYIFSYFMFDPDHFAQVCTLCFSPS